MTTQLLLLKRQIVTILKADSLKVHSKVLHCILSGKMNIVASTKLKSLALVWACCFLSQISCHSFTMKLFRKLIPSKRISNITVGKTEAASVIGCNLKCINKKPCISTLFTISKKKCVLLKSFFNDIKEFDEITENDKSVKLIESRLKVRF